MKTTNNIQFIQKKVGNRGREKIEYGTKKTGTHKGHCILRLDPKHQDIYNIFLGLKYMGKGNRKIKQ